MNSLISKWNKEIPVDLYQRLVSFVELQFTKALGVAPHTTATLSRRIKSLPLKTL